MRTNGRYRRAVVALAWSGAVAFVIALSFTYLYYTGLIPISGPPALRDVLRWQLAAWSLGVFAGPLLLAVTDRLALQRPYRALYWLQHLTIAVAAVGAHALWWGWVSTQLSPYSSLLQFDQALLFYLRWAAPMALAIYTALAISSSRATASLLSFGATSDGVLRTSARADRAEAREWETLVESMHGAVVVYDPESFAILAVNRAAVRQYGRTPPEFLQLTLFDLHHDPDLPAIRSAMRRRRALPIWRAHEWHRRSDGAPIEVELTNHAVIFSGRWARMMLVTDLTAAEQARRALAESERKFRSIFENAVVGIFRMNVDGRPVMVNEACAKLHGFDTPAAFLATVDDISEYYVESVDRHEYLAALQRDGFVADWIARMRKRDGTEIWVSENSWGVFDEDGVLTHTEGTIKDITAEIEAREALRESERQAAALRVSLAQAQLRALKLQLKPHFLFNILNTVGMMIRNGDHEKAQRVVSLLGEMFRRFLEFEGEDTVPLRQELSFVDLYLGLEQFRFEDRMLLERDIDEAALTLQVPILILQPIVENAIKHGLARISGPCKLGIRVRVDDARLVVEVSNDVRPGSGRVPGHGIGVSNTRARLRELYGNRAAFELVPTGNSMTAILTIPLEEAA